MSKLDVINLKGEKINDLKLNYNIWNIEPNDVVLKKAIDLQMSSLRQGTHKTKTRSEVSGGGRKPFRQKGTGNARQGTIRAPHYRGGGIVFGVTPRSYTFKMNKKERQLALKTALTYKAKEKELVVVDSLITDSIKTKDVKKLMESLKLAGKVLFIANGDAEKLYLATRNLGYALVLTMDEVNCYDLVNADTVVMDIDTINHIEEVLK